MKTTIATEKYQMDVTLCAEYTRLEGLMVRSSEPHGLLAQMKEVHARILDVRA
jgi:hypothetical protein